MILFPWEACHILTQCSNEVRYYHLIGWVWYGSDTDSHICIASIIPIQTHDRINNTKLIRNFSESLKISIQRYAHILSFHSIEPHWLGLVFTGDSSNQDMALFGRNKPSIILSMNTSSKLKVYYILKPSGSLVFYHRAKYSDYIPVCVPSEVQYTELYYKVMSHFYSQGHLEVLNRKNNKFHPISIISHCVGRSELLNSCISSHHRFHRMSMMSNILKQFIDISGLVINILSSCYVLYLKLVRLLITPLKHVSKRTECSCFLQKMALYSYHISTYRLIDHFIGIVIGIILTQNKDPFASLVERSFGIYTITSPEEYINWLMSWPAGLKLNGEFGKFQGEMFNCILDIYGKIMYQLLSTKFPWSTWMICLFGYASCFFGFNAFLSLCVDTFRLLCINIVSFQLVSSRLYSIHLRYILALFRLFRGKRRNILRHRIDKHDYDMEQLLLGTILFALLIFLFPTTAAYYLLFTLWRLTMSAFTGGIYGIIKLLDHYIESSRTERTLIGYNVRITFDDDLDCLFLFLNSVHSTAFSFPRFRIKQCVDLLFGNKWCFK